MQYIPGNIVYIDLCISVGYQPVHAIYHHQMLADDWLILHRIDLEWYKPYAI